MKRLVLALLAVALAVAAHGQRLWRVSPPTGDASPSHIYATMSVASRTTMPQPALDELARASAVIVRLDAAGLLSEKAAMTLDSLSAAPSDSVLNRVLTDGSRDAVDFAFNRILGTTQKPYTAINNRRRPAALTEAMLQLLWTSQFPEFANDADVATYVQTSAAAAGTPVTILEDTDGYLASLYSGSIAAQAARLTDIAVDTNLVRSLMNDMMQAYLDGDLNALDDLPCALLLPPPPKADALTMWTIENAVNRGGAFIAVDAAGLAAPSGIINLLKEDGYTVEPVE